ncbi:hypothetical protein KIW84_052535 [Lathyrus oleraceus]|uniref:Uncharacterized protein n=1 Tax=Pisum sativum TaxID=3888 RepID=A0A9D4WQB9_PEA|nr:hypothetical protein KIW84_052535 [Pisum sativum]
MALKGEIITRGLSSRVSPAPNALTFPNLKFILEANVEKYLKLVDYHIARERAFSCEDLQGFGEVVKMMQQRHWVSFNNLIREANKNICLKFYVNAEFSEVGTYTCYARRVGMPVYPDDKMIGPKAPINASTIRRLQHHHPTKAA